MASAEEAKESVIGLRGNERRGAETLTRREGIAGGLPLSASTRSSRTSPTRKRNEEDEAARARDPPDRKRE